MKTLRLLVGLAGCMLTITACADRDTSHYHGRYIWGHEVRSFQPCNTEQVYRVKASSDIQEKLRRFHQEKTSTPYASIYISFDGKLLEQELFGFAQDYDGLIQIETIMIMQADVPASCK